MVQENDINLHVVYVTAWIKKGDKFLLARRRNDDPQAGGLWSTPGGKIDLEEGDDVVEETLKREIKEEVGLEVRDDFEYLASQAFTRRSGHHVVGLIFLANYKSGQARPLEDQEEVRWATLEEIEDSIKKDKRMAYLKNPLRILKKLD